MGNVLVCDLCKKPLLGQRMSRYKVKERCASFDYAYWKNIDVHDKCMETLLKAIDEKKEDEKHE